MGKKGNQVLLGTVVESETNAGGQGVDATLLVEEADCLPDEE
jgi:hypothetical protein